MQPKQAWDIVLKLLKLKISSNEISTWLSNVKPVSIKDEIILEVENEFLKNKIEKNYLNKISEIYKDIVSKDMRIVIVSSKEDDYKEDNEVLENSEKTKKEEIKKSEFKNSIEEMKPYSPNKKYTFKNFIVGKNNEFAHAASKGVSVSPGRVYNPLFIYGGVGLGKTHLMHAIGNYVISKNPNAKVHYCSSEQFTNSLINSLKKDKMSQFREKYRKLDVLLIDDIQFIAGKESTQEEFFHTFNVLHQYSRQIVISSDRPPNEIKNIEERLVSRFTWGLIADVKAPDYETRVAILKNKAEEEKIDIQEEAIRHIAEAVKSNIRELEGSLNRVAAKASLLNRKIDFDLIEEVFKGFIEDRAKRISVSKILKSVSNFYNVPVEEMKSGKRKKEIAKSRQVSMYFMRNLLNMPFSSIGEEFGGKDHTTVIHSVNKVDSAVAIDKDLKFELEEIKQAILK